MCSPMTTDLGGYRFDFESVFKLFDGDHVNLHRESEQVAVTRMEVG